MTDTKVQELEEKITRLQESLSKLSTDTLPVPHAGADNPASIRSELSASSAFGTVTDPLVTLGTRIASVSTDDAMRLAYVRHEILRQSEISADRAHLRSMERMNFYARTALSAVAFGTGVGLVVTGFGLPGFVCLGAGLYSIAPDFIRRVTNRILPGKEP